MKYLLPAILFLIPVKGMAQHVSLTDEAALAERIASVRTAFPSDWSFVPLDDKAWRIKVVHDKLETPSAFTDMANHITYLHASLVLSEPPVAFRRLLFHEAGHVACYCKSEEAADDFARWHSR